MRILNYEEILVKRRLLELEEPINGEKKWVRVSKNGALDHWKPLSKSEKLPSELNGEVTDDIKDTLEMKFRRSSYG